MLNTIYTDKEYMAQGFTAQEVPMIREHDILFNEYQLGEVGEEVLERIEELANMLGLQGCLIQPYKQDNKDKIKERK